MGALEKSW